MSITELTYPTNAAMLDQRERELAAARFRTRTTRPEQVALIQLRQAGRIRFDTVFKAVVAEHNFDYQSFLKYEDNYDPEHRDAVDADIDIIWGRLTLLVNGEPVQSEESPRQVGLMDPDDRLPLGEAAVAQLMRDLTWLLRVDAAYDSTVAELLPSEVSCAIEAEASRRWLGDLNTVGAMIHGRPPYGHSNSVDNSRAGLIYFGDMLAHSLLRYLADYKEAESKQDEAAMYLANIRAIMLWDLLKGLVYAGSESEYSRLAQHGPRHPEKVDRMVAALVQARKDLKDRFPDFNDPKAEVQLNGESRPAPIHQLPTDELVERFRAAVKENDYNLATKL